MASTTEENYLKALYNLANAAGEVSISELAQNLQVSLPTVNSMVKTLQKGGWVIYEKYKLHRCVFLQKFHNNMYPNLFVHIFQDFYFYN